MGVGSQRGAPAPPTRLPRPPSAGSDLPPSRPAPPRNEMSSSCCPPDHGVPLIITHRLPPTLWACSRTSHPHQEGPPKMPSASRMARVTFHWLPGQGCVCRMTGGSPSPLAPESRLCPSLPPQISLSESPDEDPGVWGPAWAERGAAWGRGVCGAAPTLAPAPPASSWGVFWFNLMHPESKRNNFPHISQRDWLP